MAMVGLLVLSTMGLAGMPALSQTDSSAPPRRIVVDVNEQPSAPPTSKQVEIEETSLGDTPTSATVAPNTVSIYRFTVTR